MGGGSEYHERPLSNEEKELYAQQTQYMKEINPAIQKLIDTGTSNLDNVYTPDWNNLYSNYNNEVNQLISSNKDLSNGNLPTAWTNAKTNYYNNIYQNTMGKGMAGLAKSGVINSSRFNTSAKDWQTTLSDQASKDYTTDMNTLNTLYNSRYNYLKSIPEAASTLNTNSRKNATDYFTAATGAQQGNTSALSAISNNENSRGYITQNDGLLGGITNGIASYYGAKP
jgi:hypothetical protein